MRLPQVEGGKYEKGTLRFGFGIRTNGPIAWGSGLTTVLLESMSWAHKPTTTPPISALTY